MSSSLRPSTPPSALIRSTKSSSVFFSGSPRNEAVPVTARKAPILIGLATSAAEPSPVATNSVATSAKAPRTSLFIIAQSSWCVMRSFGASREPLTSSSDRFLTSARHRTRQVGLSSYHHLEGNPGKQELRVVVRGVAAGAVVVRPGTIELVVERILQRKFDLGPRPERDRLGIDEGHIVEFEDPTAAIGAAVVASGDRCWRVEPRVGAAVYREILHRDSVLRPILRIDVSPSHVAAVERIRRIGGDAGRLARAQGLILMDEGCVKPGDVMLADVLILSVDAVVHELVGTEALDPAGIGVGEQAEGSSLEEMLVPLVLQRHTPIGRHAGNLGLAIRMDAECALRVRRQGLVQAEFAVERVVDHGVGAECSDLLGERLYERGGRRVRR